MCLNTIQKCRCLYKFTEYAIVCSAAVHFVKNDEMYWIAHMFLECVIELALGMLCRRHRIDFNISLGVEMVRWRDVRTDFGFISVFDCGLAFKSLSADILTENPYTLHPTNVCFCPGRNSRLGCEAARCDQPRSTSRSHKHQYYRGVSTLLITVDTQQVQIINIHGIVSGKWSCQKGAV